jgi:ketosteroid isomerase-like protein
MNQDIAVTVQELLDREKVIQLIHRYCFALDRGSVEDVMALFAPECAIRVIPGQTFEKREAVNEFYSRLIRHRMSLVRHTVHNLVIELNGDLATAKSYWDVKGDLRGQAVVLGGYYADQVNKRHGKWLFSEREIRIEFAAPLAEGWGGEPKIKIRAV